MSYKEENEKLKESQEELRKYKEFYLQVKKLSDHRRPTPNFRRLFYIVEDLIRKTDKSLHKKL